MTLRELNTKIDNLRYELDEMNMIMRALRKEWYEKGSYISILKLHTICVGVVDLIEALDDLSECEKSIIGGIKL